ncbi:uncharacterized protein METZ01_LOCUS505822, partial [marine metagenome]
MLQGKQLLPYAMRWICTGLLWMFALPLLATEVRVIDAKTYYLGTPGFPEW